MNIILYAVSQGVGRAKVMGTSRPVITMWIKGFSRVTAYSAKPERTYHLH
jgi:hypothetical protein